MNQIYAKLKADQLLDLVKVYRDLVVKTSERNRTDGRKYLESRVKKTWFGFVWRDFTETEIREILSYRFDSNERAYLRQIDDFIQRLEWSCEPSGFNEVYLTVYEFQRFIERDWANHVRRDYNYFQEYVHSISRPKDAA